MGNNWTLPLSAVTSQTCSVLRCIDGVPVAMNQGALHLFSSICHPSTDAALCLGSYYCIFSGVGRNVISGGELILKGFARGLISSMIHFASKQLKHVKAIFSISCHSVWGGKREIRAAGIGRTGKRRSIFT